MRSLRDMGNAYQYAPKVSIVRTDTCTLLRTRGAEPSKFWTWLLDIPTRTGAKNLSLQPHE
jgi:hypothetical protein